MFSEKKIELIEEVFYFLIGYLKNRNENELIRKNRPPEKLKDVFDVSLPGINENTDISLFMTKLKNLLDYSVNTAHPLFMNQLYGGPNLIAVLGDIITSVLNTSIYTYEVAPLLTLIEKECVLELGKLIGFDNSKIDGTFAPGGSISNMLAMVIARDNKFPEAKEKGLRHLPEFRIFVSDQAHYSFLKGAMVFGFGTESVVKVKTDEAGRMDTDELLSAIAEEKQKGRIPIMLVATAGTTINGVFDNINDLQKIADENQMWFHVDACYGGSLLFSTEHRKYLEGIEKADSVAWDLHKMLGIPLLCASLITKEKTALLDSFSIKASYLFHNELDEYDLGNKALQCGRRVDTLKLWLTWKFEGKQGLSNRVEHMLKNARLFAEMVKENKNLKLFSEPEAAIVCFQYRPEGFTNAKINELNKNIRTKIFLEGKIIFNYSEIKGQTVLRCVISNPDITEEQLEQIIVSVVKTGNILADKNI